MPQWLHAKPTEITTMFKRMLCQFARTVSVMDHRPAETTRKARCERYARKHKTCGKPAVFVVG